MVMSETSRQIWAPPPIRACLKKVALLVMDLLVVMFEDSSQIWAPPPIRHQRQCARMMVMSETSSKIWASLR